MLATIQEYAHEKLEERGEQPRLQERYVRFLQRLVQTAEPHLYEADRDGWLQRLDSEDVNLRAALAWCRDERGTVETGLHLAGCLSLFWLLNGDLREGLDWVETMLARTGDTDRSSARAKALFGAGLLSWKQAKSEAGARYAEKALSIFRESDEPLWSGLSQWVLAVCQMAQGQIELARLLLEECVSAFKEVKSLWGHANALTFLGLNSEIRGNLDEALAYYGEGLELFQRSHDVIHTAVVLGVLAGARERMEDKEGVRRCFEELRRLPSQTRNRRALGMFLQSAAFNVQYNYRQYEAAKFLYQGSLVHWREIQRLESGFSIVRGLIGLAEIAANQGQVRRSGWLFGAADALTPSSSLYRDAFNERVAQTQKWLDAPTRAIFEAAWAEGHAATLEQAIDQALQENASAPLP